MLNPKNYNLRIQTTFLFPITPTEVQSINSPTQDNPLPNVPYYHSSSYRSTPCNPLIERNQPMSNKKTFENNNTTTNLQSTSGPSSGTSYHASPDEGLGLSKSVSNMSINKQNHTYNTCNSNSFHRERSATNVHVNNATSNGQVTSSHSNFLHKNLVNNRQTAPYYKLSIFRPQNSNKNQSQYTAGRQDESSSEEREKIVVL